MLALALLPRGERVAIVTNAGGPAIACADACAAAGLRVEPLAEETRTRLARRLPAAAAVGNPVDMLAAATPDDFRRTIECVAADPGVDAIIAIFIPPLPGRRCEPVLEAIGAAAGRGGAARRRGRRGAHDAAPGRGAGGVPVYATPEHAARALGHATRHALRRRGLAPEPPPPGDVSADTAAAVLAEALASGPGWLDMDATARLLRAYGLAARIVRDRRHARRRGRRREAARRRRGRAQGDRARARAQERRRRGAARAARARSRRARR